MSHYERLLQAVLVASFLLARSIPALAQEGAAKPKPAARVYPPLFDIRSGDQENDADQQTNDNLTPDSSQLTGLEIPTLGSPEFRHSYWVPGFQYYNLVESTNFSQTTSSGWKSTNYLVGNLSLLEAWRQSKLAINYSGGGSFSANSVLGNNNYQQLGILQDFNWRRWELLLIDQLSYLSEAQFGFAAATPLATPGVGGSLGAVLPSLQASFQPAQAIFTSVGPRYANSANAQLAYSLTPRASVTLVGSYGTLHFSDPGSIDTNSTIFGGGFSYELSPRDTIGLLYRFDADRFFGSPQALDDQVAELAYGRKITGRLALQLFAGPDFTSFRLPVDHSTSQTSGAGGANLSYKLSRSTLSLTYTHGISGGSGQFTGSRADQLQAAADFRVSRVWQATLALGYARNQDLGLSASSQTSQAFGSWSVAGGLARPLGRNANFNVAYTVNIQTSDVPICTAGTCDTSHLQQRISIGVQWHARPFVLR